MKLVLETLRTLNLSAILFREFNLFVEIHQAALLPIQDKIFSDINSFFTREIFPLAEMWIQNITSVSISEVKSTLNITINKNRTIDEKTTAEIKEKILLSEKINDVRTLEEMMKLSIGFNNSQFNLDLFLPLWWMGVKEAWHKSFLEAFMTGSEKGFINKLEISAGVVNFTDKKIPEVLLHILAKGSRFIPCSKENIAGTTKRVEKEIIDHALWYFRKIEKRSGSIPKNRSPLALLKTLQSEASLLKDKIFYKTLLIGLSDVHQTISSNFIINSTEDNILSNHILRSLSNIEDCVWNHADKNRGLILLPAKFIQNEETKIMLQLDAVKTNMEADIVLDYVDHEEHTLRAGLDDNQARLVKNFPPLKRKNIQMPFMKIKAKLHKLSEAQIKLKDINSLSFRPVNDSMFYVTNPLSKCLLVLLRDLNLDVW